jgi:hypothetical protein
MLRFVQHAGGGGLPGSAALTLAGNVVPLDPEPEVFAAMLEAWERQQRSRVLQEATIGGRVWVVCRLAAFSGLHPWQWSAAEVEAFFDDLRSGPRPITVSTVRNYQVSVRLFLAFASDARYGWAQACRDRFGQAPQQLLDEWNTTGHRVDHEGSPGRRPLTYDEVQALFDAADGRAEQIRSRGRKGALAAQRDAALLKTVYAFGLRRQEAWGLDLADLRHNPKVAGFDRFGAVFVRWGKASQGARRAAHGVDGAGDGLDRAGAAAVGRSGPPAVRAWDVVGVVGHRAVRPVEPPGRERGVRRGLHRSGPGRQAGPALAASLLRHPLDRVRLSGEVRAGPVRSRDREHHRDLQRGVR